MSWIQIALNNLPMVPSSQRFILAGQLRRDFVLFPNGKALLNVLGGNLPYAAVGLAVWEPNARPGLVARVGEDFPHEWLTSLEQHGFDTRGIRILPEAVDLRSFYVYTDRVTRISDDPVAQFARAGLPIPQVLLGYRVPNTKFDSRTRLNPTSLRQDDLLEEYQDANAAHLCPIDYLTHSLLPAVLRQNGFTTVTLDPTSGTMTPSNWDDIPALVIGLTAFMPAEDELRALFHGRSTDLWEMMETLASYGCELIIVKRGERGQLLFDAASHTRYEISAYPARLVDPTGAGDAFCGGFLAGYRKTYDPLQAVLYGSVSASLVVEGSGVFYALDALPRLAQARLEALHETVRKI
jgi:sugar/nucleoside kinase (ribokinase family)